MGDTSPAPAADLPTRRARAGGEDRLSRHVLERDLLALVDVWSPQEMRQWIDFLTWAPANPYQALLSLLRDGYGWGEDELVDFCSDYWDPDEVLEFGDAAADIAASAYRQDELVRRMGDAEQRLADLEPDVSSVGQRLDGLRFTLGAELALVEARLAELETLHGHKRHDSA